ncbi:amidoligase family protein [Thalassococcus sp. BH17M4-6]|uniref:amidoligase family protein n=1 Tax=Thalassococcus sp. BH17M4-6 TaxID=3413148 RepID=UPI003BCCCF5D
MSASPNRASRDTLPITTTASGDPRRVGVEVELGGLPEERVAQAVADTLGGTAGQAKRGLLVEGTRLGDVQVYLDSRFLNEAKDGLKGHMRELAGSVVPIEIVTEPLEPSDFDPLDDLMDHLRELGATGTTAGVLLGFGVHFNPEVTGETLDDILPVLTAFALCEDALRQEAGIDLARRVLPFVDPYPRALLDALAQGAISEMAQLIDIYLAHAASRNYALDMLALFTHLDYDRVAAVMDMAPISGRPTYHYRLPDCRIDEADWSLTLEWNRWVRVERIAADAELLEQLKSGWKKHRAALTTTRGDWTRESARMIKDAGL